ncbi:MAG: hypothetical protein M1817_003341 [Caeruleum heppii]|nr:MAG: hypothetical protein M1817_003341 [Caeruleum heppii]
MGLSPWRMCVVEHPATDTPSLLVRTDFTSTTYQVLITDLTHMWKESLGRREIIRRALEDDTSIDPSEDAAQMSILLGKIQAGLQGHHQTTLRVDRSLSTDLRLTVTSALPAPLPPLRWHMLLHRQPQTFLTAELTLPLLASHAKQQDQIRSLIVHLKDKDHVIGKLVDKLEASGMEIGAVFPMAVGARPTKKSSSRNVASKFVKGLSIFDQDDWRSQTKASNAPTQHLGDILRSFTHDAEALPSTSPTMLKVAKDEWWKSSEPQNTGTFGHLEPTHSSEDDDVRNAKPSRWPSVDEDDTSQVRVFRAWNPD